MARIEYKGVAHSYLSDRHGAQDYALEHIDLTLEDGGAYALLGPSGSGKTTLLNITSGLLTPTQGQVLLDGRDVTGLPATERNIAQVFQFPVVYDTMTVYDNLAFPLRNRGVAKSEVHERVTEVADMLELTDVLKQRASGLAADAKQKISLGRGLVRSDVAAILLDEPLTVIDPHLKWMLRRKLKQTHQRFRLTLIYVTHDQSEALTFADEVLVMRDGGILQVGSPRELFEHPAHAFVGHFIGSPGMNLLPCESSGDGVRLAGQDLPLDPAYAERARGTGGRLELGIRPEFVRYRRSAEPGCVPADITTVEDLGNYRILSARVGDQVVKAKLGEEEQAETGPGWLLFPREWTRLYADGRVVD
ncbi:MAG TPA: ABC transporter ATP-binding protein [Gammaproteobacteria bacterium]|nr:ABC transporter ATP-binding protein [Gammaproteobacteria bacterium]